MALSRADVAYCLEHPDWVRAECERLERKEAAEGSLLEFMHQGWHVTDPAIEFVDGWAISAICDHLQAVSRGEIRRLLINVPPGFSKSSACSVFWPSWEWGPLNRPSNRYIMASHGESLAMRDNLRARDLVQSDWYQESWGDRFQLRKDDKAKGKFQTSETGWRYAASVGKGITGHRGDRVIVDDPHTVEGAESDALRDRALRWFAETLPSRINDPKTAAFVVIMQRVHENDLSGHIIAKELGYEHLCIPMRFEARYRCYTSVPPTWRDVEPERVRPERDEGEPRIRWVPDEDGAELYPQDPREDDGELAWPERFDEDDVDDLEHQLRSWGGEFAVAGQLQQRPQPRGGGMFQRRDFQIVEAAPKRLDRVLRWWDLAASTDPGAAYTCGVKMGLSGGKVYVLDVVRFQGRPGTVKETVRATSEADGKRCAVRIPQDPGQAGKSQRLEYVQMLAGYDCRAVREVGDKELRAKPFAAQCEAQNVYLVRGPWNDAYIAEHCSFPRGRLKDQVDGSSGAYGELVRMPVRRKPAPGAVYERSG